MCTVYEIDSDGYYTAEVASLCNMEQLKVNFNIPFNQQDDEPSKITIRPLLTMGEFGHPRLNGCSNKELRFHTEVVSLTNVCCEVKMIGNLRQIGLITLFTIKFKIVGSKGHLLNKLISQGYPLYFGIRGRQTDNGNVLINAIDVVFKEFDEDILNKSCTALLNTVPSSSLSNCDNSPEEKVKYYGWFKKIKAWLKIKS